MRGSSTLLGCVSALVLAVTSSAAWAQKVESSDAPGAQEDGGAQAAAAEEITVTGTRVSRAGFSAPTPQTVLGAEDLQARAPANLANAVNELPQLSPSVTPATTIIGVGGGTGGANILNLRGLGTNRTLVLLNGNRVVSSTTSGGVDINLLPQGLVKRVDVVTGGASAAWGSDAVAGVVNFVLDTKFTGFKFDIQAGTSFQGDASTYTGKATYGTSFSGGRGHFLLDVNGSKQGGIDHYSDRSWYKGYKIINNPAFVAGNGQPRQLVAPADFLAATPGGIILSGPRAFTTQFAPNGAPIPFDPGLRSSPYKIGGTPNDISASYQLLVPVKYASAFGRLSFDFSDKITAYAEAAYGTSRTENTSVDYPVLGSIVIKPDNAFLPPSLAGTTFAFGKIFSNLGAPVPRNNREVMRGLVGLEGAFGGSWRWDAYYQYGQSKILNQVSNDPIVANTANAVDGVNSGGQIVCRSTLTNPGNGCVPLNPFGTARATQAQLGYVTGTSIQHIKIQQNVAAATVRGDPFSTWAGPVSLAAGIEYRTEEYRADADALSASAAAPFWVGNYKPGGGKYDVKEAFAEVVVPLIRDVPFFRSVDLNLAGRITNYSVSGTVGTYKVGLSWDVSDDIRLRGTHSRDIRAPNLNDLFLGGQSNTVVINDPVTNASASFVQVTSGSTALKPEIASADTAGIIFHPSFIPGLNLSVDYYRTSISGAITVLNALQIVTNCKNGQAEFCSAVTRNAANAITGVKIIPFNANSEKIEGIDYEASYVTDLSRFAGGLSGNLRTAAFCSAKSPRISATRQNGGGSAARATNQVPRGRRSLGVAPAPVFTTTRTRSASISIRTPSRVRAISTFPRRSRYPRSAATLNSMV